LSLLVIGAVLNDVVDSNLNLLLVIVTPTRKGSNVTSSVPIEI